MVVRQTVVLQSRVQIRRLPSPQLTVSLLVGNRMALGFGLTSAKGNRGINYKKNSWFAKNKQRKKKVSSDVERLPPGPNTSKGSMNVY
jgi:hypothetical protein